MKTSKWMRLFKITNKTEMRQGIDGGKTYCITNGKKSLKKYILYILENGDAIGIVRIITYFVSVREPRRIFAIHPLNRIRRIAARRHMLRESSSGAAKEEEYN